MFFISFHYLRYENMSKSQGFEKLLAEFMPLILFENVYLYDTYSLSKIVHMAVNSSKFFVIGPLF